MANFIIKSAAGTGNKTLIQGQDQSGSNYAIQVNDAGATTLTNATITAGTFPAGHILQVVQYSNTALVTSSSTDYVSAGLDKAITPSSTSSKVLITVTQVLDQSAAGRAARYALYKAGSLHVDFFGYSHASDSRIITHNSMMYLDSPATTSSVEYGLYFKTFGSGAHIARYSGHLGTITLMEVSG